MVSRGMEDELFEISVFYHAIESHAFFLDVAIVTDFPLLDYRSLSDFNSQIFVTINEE